MRVTGGPWTIRGHDGFAVRMRLDPDERAEVGDTLRRADGAAWVLSGVETGAPACWLRGDVAPTVGDVLRVEARRGRA